MIVAAGVEGGSDTVDVGVIGPIWSSFGIICDLYSVVTY